MIVTATVPKRHNHIWAGRGEVLRIRLKTGMAFLKMTSGDMKGSTGGFRLDTIRFHVKPEVHKD